MRAVAGIDEAEASVRRALRANVSTRCGDTYGSGVAIARDAEGYLALTNRHVIDCKGGETGIRAAVLGGERTFPRWSPRWLLRGSTPP